MSRTYEDEEPVDGEEGVSNEDDAYDESDGLTEEEADLELGIIPSGDEFDFFSDEY